MKRSHIRLFVRGITVFITTLMAVSMIYIPLSRAKSRQLSLLLTTTKNSSQSLIDMVKPSFDEKLLRGSYFNRPRGTGFQRLSQPPVPSPVLSNVRSQGQVESQEPPATGMVMPVR